MSEPELVHPCRVCYTAFCMQLAASRDNLNCVQLGALAPSFSAEGASYENELRKFVCPSCYIRRPGEVYPVSFCCRYHTSLIDVSLNSTWSEWLRFTRRTRHDLQKLCYSVSISLNSARWPPISPCKLPTHGTNMAGRSVLISSHLVRLLTRVLTSVSLHCNQLRRSSP
jgi:hypothetical protein